MKENIRKERDGDVYLRKYRKDHPYFIHIDQNIRWEKKHKDINTVNLGLVSVSNIKMHSEHM